MTRHDRRAFRCDLDALWNLFSSTSRVVRRLEIADSEARSPEESEFAGTSLRTRIVSALGHARRILTSESDRPPSPRRVARVLQCLLRLHDATCGLLAVHDNDGDDQWRYCTHTMLQARYRLKAHGIHYQR